jgi:nucleoside-diphosphate-sugar epimerase
MRVLITGVTGFLGGRLARQLVLAGHDVYGIGRNGKLLKPMSAIGVNALKVDIHDLNAYDVRHPPEIVVHCAGLSSPFGALSDFERANVQGTRKMVDLALEWDVKRFVHISSPTVYAQLKDQADVQETAPLPTPINHYARTKRRSEEVLGPIWNRSIVLRPRGLYGQGDTSLLPRLMRAVQAGPIPVLRGGEAKTDITHVSDVVRAITAAMEASSVACGEIYNISGPEKLRVLSVIEKAAELSGLQVRFKKVPFGPALALAKLSDFWSHNVTKKEPRVSPYVLSLLGFEQTLSTQKASDKLKWAPKVSFEDGLKEVFLK